jgi:septum formation protein
MPFLKIPRLILASASPRRAALLSQIGLTFEVYPSNLPEPVPPNDVSPEVVTQQLASLKTQDVAKRYTEGIVIGADTLVSFEKELLGKPQNDKHALQMLTKLSNKCHSVVTGVSLINLKENREITWSEVTKVYFRKISKDEILYYIKSSEASDKAGAYGIQGRGAAFVQRIEGCYFNVVGLPLASLVQQIAVLVPDVNI